jgi:hypothetical protein
MDLDPDELEEHELVNGDSTLDTEWLWHNTISSNEINRWINK